MEKPRDDISCEEVYEQDEPEVYFVSEGFTQEDGSIIVQQCTNDNEDRGYPAEYTQWEITYKNKEHFDKVCGKSRRGCMGSKVTVILDGVEIK